MLSNIFDIFTGKQQEEQQAPQTSMWDGIVDGISNVGSAVGSGLETAGDYAGKGLSHAFERLQDPEFQQQLQLFGAAMSDDNTRYQSALNSYDARRQEIAKQKREDMQRAEERTWKLDDAKTAHQRDFDKIDKNQENTLINKGVDHNYGLEEKKVAHGYNISAQNNQHNNSKQLATHNQTIGQQNTLFEAADFNSQQEYLSGDAPVSTTVQPATEKTPAVQTQTYEVPAHLSKNDQDTQVEVKTAAPQEQAPAPQQQASPQQGNGKGDLRTLKPKQITQGQYAGYSTGTHNIGGQWINLSQNAKGEISAAPATADQVKLARSTETAYKPGQGIQAMHQNPHLNLNEGEGKAAALVTQATQTLHSIDTLVEGGYEPNDIMNAFKDGKFLPNVLKTSEGQQMASHVITLASIKLRRDTGAAYTENELNDVIKELIVRPGDTDETREMKEKKQFDMIQSYTLSSGAARPYLNDELGQIQAKRNDRAKAKKETTNTNNQTKDAAKAELSGKPVYVNNAPHPEGKILFDKAGNKYEMKNGRPVRL